MNRALRTLAVPVAAAAVLTVSACGSSTAGSSSTLPATSSASSSSSSSGMSDMPGMSSSTSSGSSSAATHNTADTHFATDMIPHHRQAVQMATMALKSASSAKVTALAKQIKAAQTPEITTMSGWLTSWGQPVPGDMGGMDMGGMMSQADMSALAKAKGAAFDRTWLQQMTKHHQGAVTMARTEVTTGKFPAAKTLAQSIITSQNQQITQMRSLLSTIPA